MILLIIISLGAGILYGSLISLSLQKKYLSFLRFPLIVSAVLLLQLELPHLILMLITFVIGIWISVAYIISKSKDGHKNI